MLDFNRAIYFSAEGRAMLCEGGLKRFQVSKGYRKMFMSCSSHSSFIWKIKVNISGDLGTIPKNRATEMEESKIKRRIKNI